MTSSEETRRVLRAYAEAWLSSDLEKVLASYHDDIELHYMGQSPLAGTHCGRDAAFAALGQASARTSRRLIDVEDVLVGRFPWRVDCRRRPRGPSPASTSSSALPGAGREVAGVLALR